jgi:hypothetical protein
MAGFAIVMETLTLGILGLISASFLSLCLYFYAKHRVRNEGRPRRLVVATTPVPFLGLLWLVAAWLVHVEVSNRLAHQDCGFSPDPYITLPNGYVLGSGNTYDGYFRAPGFHTDVPVEGPGYVRCIIDLQFADPYFIGTQTNRNSSSIRHFTFDTRTRAFQAPEFNEPTTFEAAMTSAHDDANSYWQLYDKYRHRWPNYVLAVLIIAGEGAIALWTRKLWIMSVTAPVES